MRVNKFLKKQAHKDLQAIETDSDREFLQRLKNGDGANKIQFYNAPVIIQEQQIPQGLIEMRRLTPPPIRFSGNEPKQMPFPLDERTREEIKKHFKEKTEWKK